MLALGVSGESLSLFFLSNGKESNLRHPDYKTGALLLSYGYSFIQGLYFLASLQLEKAKEEERNREKRPLGR